MRGMEAVVGGMREEVRRREAEWESRDRSVEVQEETFEGEVNGTQAEEWECLQHELNPEAVLEECQALGNVEETEREVGVVPTTAEVKVLLLQFPQDVLELVLGHELVDRSSARDERRDRPQQEREIDHLLLGETETEMMETGEAGNAVAERTKTLRREGNCVSPSERVEAGQGGGVEAGRTLSLRRESKCG